MVEKSGKDKRIANLKPFAPGQSGNPGGRPSSKALSALYEKILSDPENVAIIEKSVMKALRGGSMAMVLLLREMADRTEGKVTLPIEASVTMNLAEAIAAGRKRAAAGTAKNGV